MGKHHRPLNGYNAIFGPGDRKMIFREIDSEKFMLSVKYRQTNIGSIVMEITGTDASEIEELREYFQRQNAPITVHPLVDCEGTWFVTVAEK